VNETESSKNAKRTSSAKPLPQPLLLLLPVPPCNAPYPPRNRQVSLANTQLSGGGPGPSWIQQQNGVVNVAAARSTVVNAPTPSPVTVAPTAPPPDAAASAVRTDSSNDVDPELARVQFAYDSDVWVYNAAYARYKEDQKRGINLRKISPSTYFSERAYDVETST
jgi:hypothetical protein